MDASCAAVQNGPFKQMSSKANSLVDRTAQLRNRVEMLRDSLLGPVPEAGPLGKETAQNPGLVNQANDDLTAAERNIERALSILSTIEKAMT